MKTGKDRYVWIDREIEERQTGERKRRARETDRERNTEKGEVMKGVVVVV